MQVQKKRRQAKLSVVGCMIETSIVTSWYKNSVCNATFAIVEHGCVADRRKLLLCVKLNHEET
jgi:hypothetical protein